MSEEVQLSTEDKLFRMMADQQEELAKFRENANARLVNLERARVRRTSAGEWDFQRLAGYALLIVFAFIFARVVFSALVAYEKRKIYGRFQVSET
jgi:hypothetical protein